MPTFSLPSGVQRVAHSPVHKTQVFKLDNGMRVVMREHFQGSAARMNLLIDCGSRQERPGERGGLHLLEHCGFLGLGGRPDGEVRTYFWAGGGGSLGNYNAFTTKNAVSYSCEAEPPEYKSSLKTLHSMLVGDNLSAIPVADYEREKLNVASEQERNNAGSSAARTTLTTAMSMVDHALGLTNALPTIGIKQDYLTMSLDSLKALHRRVFSVDRATLVLTGVQDNDGTFLAAVRDEFGSDKANLHVGPLDAPARQPLSFKSTGVRVQSINSGNRATFLCLAVPVPGMVTGTPQERAESHASRVALGVIGELLVPTGAPQSGLLSEMFDAGYVYDAGVVEPQTGYSGPMSVLLAVPADTATEVQRLTAVQNALLSEIASTLHNYDRVPGAEAAIASAVQRMRAGANRVALGGIDAAHDALLQGVRYRDPTMLFEMGELASHITPSAVAQVAQKVFCESNIALVRHWQAPVANTSQLPPLSSLPGVSDLVQRRLSVLQESPDTMYATPNMARYASVVAPLQMRRDAASDARGVMTVRRPVAPVHLARVSLLYPQYAKSGDNWGTATVMADLLGRELNKHMRTAHTDAEVVVSARADAGAMRLTLDAVGRAAPACVATMASHLSDGLGVDDTAVTLLARQHQALVRGAQNSEASTVSALAIDRQMYGSDAALMRGFASVPFDVRLAQLEAVATSPGDLLQHVRNMGAPQSVSHAHVLNGVSLAPVVVRHFEPTGRAMVVSGTRPSYSPAPATPEAVPLSGNPELFVRYALPVSSVTVRDMNTDMDARVALELVATSLGNSFAGRLMRTLRAEHGLTYGATSHLVLGSYMSPDASPVLEFTSTFKPRDVQRGTSLAHAIVSDALRGDTSLMSKSSEAEFDIAKRALISQWERQSVSRPALDAVMGAHMLHGVDYDARLQLIHDMTFRRYCQVLNRVLPRDGARSMYGVVVGNGLGNERGNTSVPRSVVRMHLRLR